MYSMIIRGNIDSEDVEISENSHDKFQEKIKKLITSIPIKPASFTIYIYDA